MSSDLKSYLKATEFLCKLISGTLDFLNKMYVPDWYISLNLCFSAGAISGLFPFDLQFFCLSAMVNYSWLCNSLF